MKDKQPAWNCDTWVDKNGNQILSVYYVDPDSAKGYGSIYFDKSGEEISTHGVELDPVDSYVGKAVSEGSKEEGVTSSPAPHISLRTISSPEGADIFLDGKYVGVTPKNIPINDLETHSIRLELNGYENWEEECTFDQLDTNEIVASLYKTQSATVTPVNTTTPNFLGLSALITILSAYFIMKKNE